MSDPSLHMVLNLLLLALLSHSNSINQWIYMLECDSLRSCEVYICSLFIIYLFSLYVICMCCLGQRCIFISFRNMSGRLRNWSEGEGAGWEEGNGAREGIWLGYGSRLHTHLFIPLLILQISSTMICFPHFYCIHSYLAFLSVGG